MSKTVMLRGCRLFLVLGLTLGLARAAVEKPVPLEEQPAVTYRYPVLTAPRLSPAPVIDGVVDKAEWSAAAQSLPLVDMQDGQMLTEPSVYWVGQTDEALYLAFRFLRPPHAGGKSRPVCQSGAAGCRIPTSHRHRSSVPEPERDPPRSPET